MNLLHSFIIGIFPPPVTKCYTVSKMHRCRHTTGFLRSKSVPDTEMLGNLLNGSTVTWKHLNSELWMLEAELPIITKGDGWMRAAVGCD